MKTIRALAIAATAAAVLAAPTLACQYEPTASVRFCGDPRADISIDATNVSEAFTAKIVWKTGNKALPGPARRVATPSVSPGEILTLRRWVLGGSDVIIRGRDGELLLRATARTTGPCVMPTVTTALPAEPEPELEVVSGGIAPTGTLTLRVIPAPTPTP